MIEPLSFVEISWTDPAKNRRPFHTLLLISMVQGNIVRTEYAFPWEVEPTEEHRLSVLQKTMVQHLNYVAKRLKETTNENPS